MVKEKEYENQFNPEERVLKKYNGEWFFHGTIFSSLINKNENLYKKKIFGKCKRI